MIPLATTTIAVWGVRPEVEEDSDGEGYPNHVTTAPSEVATGVRACISLPNMERTPQNTGEDGAQTTRRALRCDYVDLRPYDTVIDETTGVEYEVQTVDASDTETFGMEHLTGKLRITKGT